MSSSSGLRRPPPMMVGGPHSSSRPPTTPSIPGHGGQGGEGGSSSRTSSPMMSSSSSTLAPLQPPIPASGSGLSSRASSPRGGPPLPPTAGTTTTMSMTPRQPLFHRPPTPGHPRAVKASSDAAAYAAAPGPPMGPNAVASASASAASVPATPSIDRSNSEDTQDSTGGSSNTPAAGTTASRFHRPPRSLPRPPAPRQRNTAAGTMGVSRFRLPPTTASASAASATTPSSTLSQQHPSQQVTPANTPHSSPLVPKTTIITPQNNNRSSPSSPPIIFSTPKTSSSSSSSPPVVVPTPSPKEMQQNAAAQQPLFLSSSSSAVTTTTPPPLLPEGWTEVQDDSSGRVYYYNAVTGMTTWDRPNITSTIVAAADVVEGSSSPGDTGVETKPVVQALTNDDSAMTTAPPAAAVAAAGANDNGENNNPVEDFSETAYATPPESGASPLAAEVTEANIQATTTAVVENTEQEQLLLPPGWAEAFDVTFNRVYYFNNETGETSWDRPEPLPQQKQSSPSPAAADGENADETMQLLYEAQLEDAVVAAPSACPDQPEDTGGGDANEKQPTNEHQPDAYETTTELPPGWVQATDPTTNRVYYYNSETDETKWDRPLPSTVAPTEEAATPTGPRPAAGYQPEDTGGGDGSIGTPESPLANELPETADDTTKIAPSPLPLAPGWVESIDPISSRAFYRNTATGETQWDRPISMQNATMSQLDIDSEQEDQGPPLLSPQGNFAAPDASSTDVTNEVAYLPEEGPPIPSTESPKDAFISHGISVSLKQPEDTFVPGTDSNNDENEDYATEPLEQASPDRDEQPTAFVDDGNGATAVDQSDLPAGWVEAVDPTSLRTYYFNAETDETTWERPVSEEKQAQVSPSDELEDSPRFVDSFENQDESTPGTSITPTGPTFDGETMEVEEHVEGSATSQDDAEEHVDSAESEPPSELPSGWALLTDTASQQVYYYNSETGETRWDPPEFVCSPAQIAPIDSQDEQEPLASQSEDFYDTAQSGLLDEASLSQEQAEPFVASVALENTVAVDKMDLPTVSTPTAEDMASLLIPGWEEFTDTTSQQVYYYNSETGETRWDPPYYTSSPPVQGEIGTSPIHQETIENIQSDDFCDAEEIGSTEETAILPESPVTMAVDATPPGSVVGAEEHTGDLSNPSPAAEENTSALLPGWTEVIDATSQQVYYYNSETGESRWDPPESVDTPVNETPPVIQDIIDEPSTSPLEEFHDAAEARLQHETSLLVPEENPEVLERTTSDSAMSTPAPAEKASLPDGWTEVTDPSTSNVYYYNVETGETRWDPPVAIETPSEGESGVSPIHLETNEPSHSEDFCDATEIGPSEEAAILLEHPQSMAATMASPESTVGVSEQSPMTEEMMALAPGWTTVTDPSSSNVYYYNSETGESRWDPPEAVDGSAREASPVIQDNEENSTGQSEQEPDEAEAVMDETCFLQEQPEAIVDTAVMESSATVDTVDATVVSSPPTGQSWTEVIDPSSSKVYYYNSETGESRWDPPEAVDDAAHEASPITQENEEPSTSQSEEFRDPSGTVPDESPLLQEESETTEAATVLESTGAVENDPALSSPEAPLPLGEVGLPPGWEQVTDSSSNVYYYNSETGESRWDPPEAVEAPAQAHKASPVIQDNDEPQLEFLDEAGAVPDEAPLLHEQTAASESTSDDPAISPPASAEMAGLPPGWEVVTDPTSNSTYYFNSETEETRWDPPEAVDSSAHEAPTSSQDKDEHSAGQSEALRDKGEAPVLPDEDSAANKTKDSQQTEASEPSKLKPGWEEVIDPSSSDVYYYNSETGESQWDPPLLGDETAQENVKTQDSISQGVEGSGLSAPESRPHDQPPGQELDDHGWVEVDDPNSALPSGWEKMIDETSGDPYYLNRETGATSWSIPEARGAGVGTGAGGGGGENEIAEGWVHTKDPSKRNAKKPGKVVATFGFGGRLCMIGSQGCKQGSVVIDRVRRLVPKEPLVQAENEKLAAGVVGPLNDAEYDRVNSYLAKKAEEVPSDILWNLILIACQNQGTLRSRAAMGDPNSPETAMVNLLLRDNENGNTNDGSASTGSQIEAVAKDETSLATIQDLLVRGKRNAAVEEAVRGGHFALALLVAGMCSRETYQQVGRQFVEHNLSAGSPLHTVAMLFCDPHESSTAASSLFDSRDTSQILRTWKSHLASIISNRRPGWETIVLSLADRLAKAGNHDAAHFCYMVCGTSIANPFRKECRLTLVGCKIRPGDLFLSTDTSIVAYARTEAHEWAKRRGNPTAAFSSLQAFKVVYARLLADYGFEKAALRYIRSIIDCMAADSSEITASMQSSLPFGLAVFMSDRAGLLRALAELEERLERNCNAQSSQYESKKPVPVEADVDISFLSAQSQLPDAAQKIDTRPSWNTGVQSQQSGHETFVSIEPQQLWASGKAPPHQYPPAAQDSGDGAPAHSTNPVSQLGASLAVQTPGKGQATFMSPSQPRAQNVPHPVFQTPVNDQQRMMMGQAKEASQGPPPIPLTTPQMQSGEHKGDKQNLSEAKVFHSSSLHSQPPQSEGPARQQEAVSQLPPPQDHPSITRTSAAVPKLTKIAQPPVSAPPNMQKQSKAGTPTSSASKSGVLFGLRTWMTKKMNPDATQADIGEAMTARFDEKLGRWIFPGDDPNEVIPSLAPPPKIPLGTPAPAPAPAAASNDPLAAMMAPPQRGPRSGSRTTQGMRLPPGSSPPITAPPQFAVFTPPPGAKKTSED